MRGSPTSGDGAGLWHHHRMTSRSWRALGITALVVILLAVIAFTIFVFWVFPRAGDGDRMAREAANEVADGIAANTDNTAEYSIEELVDMWVPAERIGEWPGEATVEPLAWSGAIGGAEPATIDIRVHVAIEAKSATSIGEAGWSAGESTACYRLVWPRYYPAQTSEIDCPDGPPPSRPIVTEPIVFTDDDRAHVAALLGAATDAEALERALRRSFPTDVYTVDVAEAAGELIAAVGIPENRSCILVVRMATGELAEPSYDRIQLEPGELGCSTQLYTNPPL